jgi:hypothetical protein
MPNWNDVIEAGFDWSSAEWINMLIDAVNERQSVHSVDYNPLEHVSEGDVVQASGFWAEIQQRISGSLPQFCELPVRFINLTPPRSSDDESMSKSRWVVPWSFQTIMASIGVPPPSIPSEARFTRKRPRTVLSVNSLFDTESNAATVGQLAELNNGGPLVEFDGTEWVTPTDIEQRPDLLEPTNARPDYCRPGLCRRGDYLGEWLFRELRDILNKMTATDVRPRSATSIIGTDAYLGRSGQAYAALGFGMTWDEIKAAAELAWDSADHPGTTTGVEGYPEGYFYYIGQLYEGGPSAFSTSVQGQNEVGPLVLATLERTGGEWGLFEKCAPRQCGIARESDIYVVARNLSSPLPIAGGYLTHVFSEDVFSTNGDPFAVQDLPVLWTTMPAYSESAVRLPPWPGNLSQKPVWCGPPEYTGHDRALGYLGSLHIINRWDVVGGFQYTANT